MDWKDLAGTLAKAGAPIIGAALGGPIGGTIGGIVGKFIAEALGVEETPEAVNNAIQTGDPATVNAALASADAQAQVELEKLKAYLADVQDAREMQVQLVTAGSALQWGAPVVSILITIGFLSSLAILMLVKINFTEVAGQALLLLIGSLATMQTQVVNYWLGSSQGSADKSAQIAAIAATQAKPAVRKR